MTGEKPKKSQLNMIKSLASTAGYNVDDLLDEITLNVADKIAPRLINETVDRLSEKVVQLNQQSEVKLAKHLADFEARMSEKLEQGLTNQTTKPTGVTAEQVQEFVQRNNTELVRVIKSDFESRIGQMNQTPQAQEAQQQSSNPLAGLDFAQIIEGIKALKGLNDPLSSLSELPKIRERLDPLVQVLYPQTGLTPAQEAQIGNKFFEAGYKFRDDQMKRYSGESTVPKVPSRSAKPFIKPRSLSPRKKVDITADDISHLPSKSDKGGVMRGT